MTEMKTHGYSARVGEVLALGMVRFADSEDRPLWRIRVTRYCGGEVLIEEDATVGLLLEIESWVRRARETLKTDGGRAAIARAGGRDEP